MSEWEIVETECIGQLTSGDYRVLMTRERKGFFFKRHSVERLIVGGPCNLDVTFEASCTAASWEMVTAAREAVRRYRGSRK